MTVNGYHVRPYGNLCSANLCYTDLGNKDLYCANLARADMRKADFGNANFTGANLFQAQLDKSEKCRLGEKLKEDIIGYKKCYVHKRPTYIQYAIVELIIPRGAIVFSINGEKCRTDKAKVKAIYDMDGNPLKRACSMHNLMSYYVGDEIEVFNFNCQYNVECGEGIHFFKTLEEAKNY